MKRHKRIVCEKTQKDCFWVSHKAPQGSADAEIERERGFTRQARRHANRQRRGVACVFLLVRWQLEGG